MSMKEAFLTTQSSIVRIIPSDTLEDLGSGLLSDRSK